MWGFTDKYGSMSGPINKGEKGTNYSSPNWGAYYSDSLIMDPQYQKRSAYSTMLNVMKPPTQPSVIKKEAEEE